MSTLTASLVYGCGSSTESGTSPSNQPDASFDGTSEDSTPGADSSTAIDSSTRADSSTSNDSSAPADGSMGATDTGAAEASVGPPPPDYLWYVLDETSGVTAHDSTSHHFDITNLTGVTWSAGANFAMNGSGSTTVDDHYRVPPETITAWLTPVERTDSPTTYALGPYPPNALSDDIPGVGGWGVGLNVWSTGSALAVEGTKDCVPGLCVASATQNAMDQDGGPSCASVAKCQQGFTAGNETFVAVTFGAPPDAGAAAPTAVYVDGALFDQTTAGVFASSSSPPIYLGRQNNDTGYSTARFFNGRIRDVRVYQRELPASEVADLYAIGPTLHAPPETDAGAVDAGGD